MSFPTTLSSPSGWAASTTIHWVARIDTVEVG